VNKATIWIILAIGLVCLEYLFFSVVTLHQKLEDESIYLAFHSTLWACIASIFDISSGLLHTIPDILRGSAVVLQRSAAVIQRRFGGQTPADEDNLEPVSELPSYEVSSSLSHFQIISHLCFFAVNYL
jgi:hypothetical protein